MNKSDESWIRWLDGAMTAAEAEDFEATLPDAAAAREERDQWQRVRAAIRADVRDTPDFQLGSDADFLASQIARAIRAESCVRSAQRGTPSWLEPARLAWTGLGFAAAALLLTLLLVPKNDGVPDETRFISQVIEAHSANPARYGVSSFAAPDGRGTVIWVQDPGFIPAQDRIR